VTDQVKVFERFGDVWVTGEVDVVDELMSAHTTYHLPPFPDMDREALKQFIAGFHQAFPDFALTIEDDLVSDDRSVHRWSCSGTFSGDSPILPVGATGQATHATGCHVVTWRDGRPAEIWHFGDWMGWLQRAGVLPALG